MIAKFLLSYNSTVELSETLKNFISRKMIKSKKSMEINPDKSFDIEKVTKISHRNFFENHPLFPGTVKNIRMHVNG